MNWIFTYNLSTTLWEHTWPHYARNLALSESCKTVAGRHAAKHKTKSQSVLCSKMLCNILTRMLNCSIHWPFSEKTACSCKLNHAQSNLSKCTAKVVSLEASRSYVYKEGLVFWVSLGTEPLSNLRAPIWLQKRQNYVGVAQERDRISIENVSST